MAAEFFEQRGFILVEVAGGWRFQSHPDLRRTSNDSCSKARRRACRLPRSKHSRSSPTSSRSRGMQISAIRGVNVDGVVRTLEHRGYIGEVGHDPGPGTPTLFGTTPLFLERLGLANLDDLPPIADFVPSADVVEALEEGLRVEPDIIDVDQPVPDSEEAAAGADEG